MYSNSIPSPSEACPETMNFLSHTWCDFAVQALQPERMEKSTKVDATDLKSSLPSWKSIDVKVPCGSPTILTGTRREINVYDLSSMCSDAVEDSPLQGHFDQEMQHWSAIAAENSKRNDCNMTKEAAITSAAALVAAQYAKVAEAMGAKKEQLGSVIGSATSGTGASEILTLTASANC
ncbi:hypothetical protein F3Y22_tig00006988pilonHSYRG00006 [Hibiscus syriacus]|uniref:VAN3-binding protein-like auxin canalisation domain-containing protein n=1 Tax=Hibiscus syriacus TaxID=106335 RepID=A0A6A3CB41_HIBSY|nr:hypothetical protein F3Y22_tig00006988pilonHSYRG00006 [Hibiscus syriacus]